jgi:hypothetical protein
MHWHRELSISYFASFRIDESHEKNPLRHEHVLSIFAFSNEKGRF